MNSDTLTIAGLFSQGELIQYHLPCFQRGHTWRQEQWDDLLMTSGASMTNRGWTEAIDTRTTGTIVLLLDVGRPADLITVKKLRAILL